jgi:phosphinothricin acetyltransferase
MRTEAAGIHIRPATIADLPGILDIYNEAVQNTTASYDYEPRTTEAQIAWFEEKAKGNYPVFVAEDERGRIVGWGALSAFRGRIGYRFTVEDSVYVAADQRGRGIGKRLLAALIVAARERGFHAIIAGIDAEGEASVRLHEAFGFERVAYLKEVGYKFGRWLDVVLMELLLE